ncbi:MAG: hypothetical protein UV37_C0021G0005 [Candidatus Collierbacteria bacterium GW2011_GWA1_42_60]|nr:MAG: hypothetical protein UV37_C0021G0005 [Candidatus Collierbacteria bacterium GW2011_GWA1_42_60]
METTFISTSYEETREIAKKFADKLEKGTTICLYGELAAGKTTFTQGIGQALGIDRLVSPTFLIMRQYPVTNHPVIKTLFHLDLYRLNSIEDIKAFDVEEIWSFFSRPMAKTKEKLKSTNTNENLHRLHRQHQSRHQN